MSSVPDEVLAPRGAFAARWLGFSRTALRRLSRHPGRRPDQGQCRRLDHPHGLGCAGSAGQVVLGLRASRGSVQGQNRAARAAPRRAAGRRAQGLDGRRRLALDAQPCGRRRGRLGADHLTRHHRREGARTRERGGAAHSRDAARGRGGDHLALRSRHRPVRPEPGPLHAPGGQGRQRLAARGRPGPAPASTARMRSPFTWLRQHTLETGEERIVEYRERSGKTGLAAHARGLPRGAHTLASGRWETIGIAQDRHAGLVQARDAARDGEQAALAAAWSSKTGQFLANTRATNCARR